MFLRRLGRLAPVLLAALIAPGCSGSSNNDVEGTVTFNGAPVAGAKVAFHSVAANDSKEAKEIFSAVTDSAGRFKLVAAGKKGVPAGGYKVVVTKYRQQPGTAVPEDEDPEQLEASGAVLNDLPPQYAKLNTTPVAVTVKDGKNKIDVAVEGQAEKK